MQCKQTQLETILNMQNLNLLLKQLLTFVVLLVKVEAVLLKLQHDKHWYQAYLIVISMISPKKLQIEEHQHSGLKLKCPDLLFV